MDPVRKIWPAGTYVTVQNDGALPGTVRAHFVAPGSYPGIDDPAGLELYYVVALDRGGWLGGTSCADGRAYVRDLVAHADNVTSRCHAHNLPGSHRCSDLCTHNKCCIVAAVR